MSDDPLSDWRLHWSAEELEWRQLDWTEQRDQRRAEREMRRRERKRMDRKVFGPDLLPGTFDAHFNEEQLRNHGLPLLKSERELAVWLDISLERLRWFSFDRPADTVWHYVRYTVPKRSGGQRVILAPKSELKALQRKILHEVLSQIPAHPAAHGFVPGRSIVSNAKPHVGAAFVLKLDLKDFFPSITFKRVRGLFASFGYSSSLASTLALLCTARDRIPYQHGDITYFVSNSSRHLVQGAPTSPALANLIARSLDKRLHNYSNERGVTYTRYADDLTFSYNDLEHIHLVREAAYHIIEHEGFRANHAKTRIMSQASRQMVTGIIVNTKASTPRELRRKLRAILHNAQRTGLQAQNVDEHPNFRAYLYGLIGYVHAANPQQAAVLGTRLKSVPD